MRRLIKRFVQEFYGYRYVDLDDLSGFARAMGLGRMMAQKLRKSLIDAGVVSRKGKVNMHVVKDYVELSEDGYDMWHRWAFATPGNTDFAALDAVPPIGVTLKEWLEV